MGNKIITEKDFWRCSCGAVPAQFQSTQKTAKKKSGEKYITIRDTATSSWIDFGCTRMMLIMAIIAAAVVVIAAMTVATGGAALIALGALAGLAGAAWGAIIGTMLCGQLAAKARVWVGSKKNYIVQGVETVTGDHTMTCPVGGVVTFAPEIKNWSQAISLGAANYIGGLMEGMMAGAAIGMGGAALSGGAGAFATGGMRGVGQAALQFAKSAPMNVLRNIGATFGYAGAGASSSTIAATAGTAVGLRTLTATQAGLQHYGSTGESGWGAAGRGVFGMEEGMYHSGANILSGKGTWQDVTGLALLLTPVHKAPEELNAKKNEPVHDGEPVNDGEQKKANDETVKDANAAPEETVKKEGDGEAYEAEYLKEVMAQRRQTAIDFYKKYNPDMDIADITNHVMGIDLTKPVEVVRIPPDGSGPKGNELYQFTKVNTKGDVLTGNYYADNPNSKPNDLGVSERYNLRDPDNGWKHSDQIGTVKQEKIIFDESKPVEGLRSTSAEINDTWSLKDEVVHTDGGGGQIYIPKQ